MSPITRTEAEALDRDDPIAALRQELLLPENLVYLDGNSLGPLPATTPGRLDEVVRRQWGECLISSWNTHRWIDLPLDVGNQIAPLIGAEPGTVVAADTVSVNLFKLLGAAIELRPDRPVILSERDNFPTDLYMAQGLQHLLGGRVELRLVSRDELPGAVDKRVAVVMLTHVDFRSGRMYDMAEVTALAHRHGAIMLWDLAHTAGAVPVDLGDCEADLAVGCGYKYLNGGPGAPAFVYVARALQGHVRSPLWGWMGHSEPFALSPTYSPAGGLRSMQCGTPPVLGLVALSAGVELVARAGIPALRAKSVALSELFIRLMDERCGAFGFELASPRQSDRRGSQVAFRHPHGFPVIQALARRGVVGDFREPDILRFGLAPLHLRHVDVWDAVTALCEVMEQKPWQDPELCRRAFVT